MGYRDHYERHTFVTSFTRGFGSRSHVDLAVVCTFDSIAYRIDGCSNSKRPIGWRE